MLVLLPFLIIGLGVSIGLCSAAGYTGALLVVLLVAFFLAGFVGSMVLYVLLLGLISLTVDKEKPQPRPAPFFRATVTYIMGLLTALARIRLHVTGTERLPEGRWLLVGNHRSAFDPIVTGWALRRCGIVFISKPENLRIPIVGQFVHKAGFLGIDRDNDRAALRTILSAAELLKNDYASVAVYPEGTRNREAGLLPFRNGVFKIAQKAKVPVAVAAIRGTEQIARRFPWRATDVYLDICGVMDAQTVLASKTHEIGEVVQAWIIDSANT